jgi:hypothetical protein
MSSAKEINGRSSMLFEGRAQAMYTAWLDLEELCQRGSVCLDHLGADSRSPAIDDRSGAAPGVNIQTDVSFHGRPPVIAT